MPFFIVERTFPDPVEEVPPNPDIPRVHEEMDARWLGTFLAQDGKKSYCLHEAPNPDAIRRAAEELRLPIDEIVEVEAPVGPAFVHLFE